MSIPRTTLVAYALPAVPLAALTLPLYIILPTFYSETLGLPLAAVGSALLAVRLFDALSDPVIGWIGDRWRPAFGRRRALFLASIPMCALAGLMLFWPPVGVGAAYLLGWGIVLSIGFTMAMLAYQAWGAELATDYRERSRVAGYREAFTLAGTLLAILLPFAIGFEAPTGLHGLAVVGLFVAIALPVAGTVAVVLVGEPRDHSSARVNVMQGLAVMAANAPFRRFILAYLFNGLANAVPATLFLYFVSDRLGMPEMRGPLLFLYFAAGIAGVPLALRLAARYGKHRAWCLAMIATCTVFATAPLIGPGNLAAFALVCALTGLALGFDLSLPAAIQADIVDVDTAASSEQRSAQYFAAWSLTTKLALALGVGIAFPLLALFGFAPGQANGFGSLMALAVIYGWAPILLKAVAIGLMWNFPLDEAGQRSLRDRIEGRRECSIG
jgi:glycoside/pentoside/hexuronide:cation symporter, GPH family